MVDARVSLLPLDCKLASPQRRLTYAAMETMGDRIRTLRESKGWTQDDLVDRLMARLKETDLTVSRNAVSQWERGETKNIKNVIFYMLIQELGTTPEYVLFGPDRSTPSVPPSASGRFGKKRA